MKRTKAEFKALHQKEKPIILMNCWDQQSAEILDKNDIAVIATSSYAVSAVLGFQDGENISFKQLRKLSKKLSGDFVSIDLESGYAREKRELQENLNALVQDNIVGINIEDKYPNTNRLIEIEEQEKRLLEISKSEAGKHLFLNARTDIFFTEDSFGKNYDRKALEQTIERGKRYTEAGCDSLFIPGLKNKEFIHELTESIQIPVNIMIDTQQDDINDYLGLGISRISYGPSLYIEWTKSGLSQNDYLVSKIKKIEKADRQQLIRLKK